MTNTEAAPRKRQTKPVVRAVLTGSGHWVHLAQVDMTGDSPRKVLLTGRTVCGSQVTEAANPGMPNCHRCRKWADARRIDSVQDVDGTTFTA